MRFALFICLSAFILATPAHAQKQMGIVAIVNQDAISQSDVQDRMRLILVSSGLPPTADMQKRVLPQVVDGLIEEQLKIQEAQRNNLEVTDEDIAEGFKSIAEGNKFTVEQFEQIMKQQGIPKSTLENQIRAQVAWSKVVQKVIRPGITVSPNDVAARVAKIKNMVGKTEFLVSEILLPVDQKDKDGDARQLAAKISAELNGEKAPPFEAVARQFSKAPGAETTGGTLGWVPQGQLPPELDAALVALAEGQVSAPVLTQSGYHILQLKKKRTITEESIPSQDNVFNAVGQERLNRAQARHLSDLRAVAYIDRRF